MRRAWALALAALLVLAPARGGAEFAGRGAEIVGTLRGANFNSTADQAINIPPQITSFIIAGIGVTNCSVNPSSAVGGFYSGAGKTGTVIVSASHAYSNITSPTYLAAMPLTAGGAGNTFSGVVYFSLTTPNGTGTFCDIFVLGLDVS